MLLLLLLLLLLLMLLLLPLLPLLQQLLLLLDNSVHTGQHGLQSGQARCQRVAVAAALEVVQAARQQELMLLEFTKLL